MADQQQYPLPNPGLPLGQQAVSPVAQTNPLQSLQGGLIQGGQLGLQAKALQLQAQQQQAQQQQIQASIRAQQQQVLNEALTQAHATFDSLSKVDDDMAIDYYHKTIAPMQDTFWQQHGVALDSSQIPASHNNVDTLNKASKLTQMAIDDPSKFPAAMSGMTMLNNQMDIGQLTREKLAGSMKNLQSIQDYNNHLDTLEQNYSTDISTMKSRSGTYGAQDAKVALAAHLRTLANSKYDPKTGNYNVQSSQYPEMVMGLANLISPSGTADAETRKNLESMTLKGKLNQAVQAVTGVPQVGNTQAIIKNIVDSIDRQGLTAQQLRDQELSQVKPSADLPPERAARVLGNGRGADFNDYLPGGKYGPKQSENGWTKEKEIRLQQLKMKLGSQ